uniref:Uracil-DNA glycosylase n=1 Tax=Ditylenchus dipsaci TaxID=166011 RepID=A0A915CYG6_9BILA
MSCFTSTKAWMQLTQGILLHNNAIPHKGGIIFAAIGEKGWQVLHHPANFPTEAPTDYHVSRSLSNWQQGTFFKEFEDVVAKIKA